MENIDKNVNMDNTNKHNTNTHNMYEFLETLLQSENFSVCIYICECMK